MHELNTNQATTIIYKSLSLFSPPSICNPPPHPTTAQVDFVLGFHKQQTTGFFPPLFCLVYFRNIAAAMVSIRRRKLLGLCSGLNSSVAPLSKSEHGQHTENQVDNTKPISVHPMVLDDIDPPKEIISMEIGPGSSNVPASSPSKEHPIHQFPEVKRRKRHRRKHIENQEHCIMRGVYFKNMKWQAAIKVDKKQIHLGTVGSQEEAARLYDRAAFMCGREPNFELSENEKQELRKFNWDEFLAVTRSAITNKKSQRKPGPGSQRKLDTNDWEGKRGRNGFSTSVDDVFVP